MVILNLLDALVHIGLLLALYKLVDKLHEHVPVDAIEDELHPRVHETYDPPPGSLSTWIDQESEAWAREELWDTALALYDAIGDWKDVEVQLRQRHGGMDMPQEVAENMAWSTVTVEDD